MFQLHNNELHNMTVVSTHDIYLTKENLTESGAYRNWSWPNVQYYEVVINHETTNMLGQS